MRRRVFSRAVFSLLLAAAGAWAAEPILGTWQLDHQELNGQTKETEPETLRISAQSDRLLFAFSVPVNNIDFVSMTYSAKLDGSEADVKNAQGTKVGTVQVTKSSPSQYKVVLKGTGRPDAIGHLTVSADGKTLTSESDATQAGHQAHLVQSFVRQ